MFKARVLVTDVREDSMGTMYLAATPMPFDGEALKTYAGNTTTNPDRILIYGRGLSKLNNVEDVLLVARGSDSDNDIYTLVGAIGGVDAAKALGNSDIAQIPQVQVNERIAPTGPRKSRAEARKAAMDRVRANSGGKMPTNNSVEEETPAAEEVAG